MSVPRQTGTVAERLKVLEQEIQRFRGALAIAGVDATITTPANLVTVTSATWVEVFTAAGPRQAGDWTLRFTAVCAAGTAGQVRAVVAGTSTELMAPVDVLDGSTLAAEWAISPPGDFDDYAAVEIQAQRVTGSGSFTVRPYSVAGA